LRVRIVRYGLVGGIGIPVNLLALAVFLHLMGDRLYPLASACAFEVSTTVNFALNQLFTYSDQKHLHGWDWPKRALKAQLTSLSALGISFLAALALKYGLHVSPYAANALGIVIAFFYNFSISNRLVFRPAPSSHGTSTEKV
jgi:putative flippase GtrA